MSDIQRRLYQLATAPTVATSAVYANACGDGAREIDRLREAIEVCLVGGSHLANVLIGRLGGGFASLYPTTLTPDEALRIFGSGENYDLWCCWSAMMRARDMRDRTDARRDYFQGSGR